MNLSDFIHLLMNIWVVLSFGFYKSTSTHVPVFVWKYAFMSFGQIHQSRLAALYGKWMVKFGVWQFFFCLFV